METSSQYLLLGLDMVPFVSLIMDESIRLIINHVYYRLLGNWEDASNYAQNLTDNCKWCPAVNSHQVACFLYMKYEQDGCKSNELKQKITHAMRYGKYKIY